MAGDEDAGLIVLDRNREELVSIAADALLFLAVLLLAFGAVQLAAIADAEDARLRLEQDAAAAKQDDSGVFLRCSWTVGGGEIGVVVGNAGERSVFLDRVQVAARDTGGAGYVQEANLTTTLLLPPAATKTMFLDRARFDGELLQGVTLEAVADTGPFAERSRTRETVRCMEAADGFLRVQ